ncbi:MAG: hypothetical protein H0V45_09760 [Actinobacteria bacterium]|nr:hypothetical protein [Actinomycetota bacterium]
MAHPFRAYGTLYLPRTAERRPMDDQSTTLTDEEILSVKDEDAAPETADADGDDTDTTDGETGDTDADDSDSDDA